MSQRFNGERARRRRFELGLTAEQVGDLIGAPKSYISQIEQGVFEPGPARFAALVTALDLTPDDLWVTDPDKEGAV